MLCPLAGFSPLSPEGFPYLTTLTALPPLSPWQPESGFLFLWICPLWTTHVCTVGCCTAEISLAWDNARVGTSSYSVLASRWLPHLARLNLLRTHAPGCGLWVHILCSTSTVSWCLCLDPSSHRKLHYDHCHSGEYRVSSPCGFDFGFFDG